MVNKIDQSRLKGHLDSGFRRNNALGGVVMKSSSTVIIAVILSAITAFIVGKYTAAPNHSEHIETSYERVVRTQTLRCGYQYWDGAVMRDKQTNQIYGPWVDIMNAIGKATGLEIEWTEQVGWDSVSEALKSNKIDAMCAGMWTSAARAKEMAFSKPLAYQAIEAFVRSNDHRFDGDIQKLNDPSVKIIVIDNDNSDFIARTDFPRAQRVSLSLLNGTDSEEMLAVMTGKADIALTVAGLWQQFNKANPGAINRVAPDHKLRAFGLVIAMNNDDIRLTQIIDAGVDEIRDSGFLDKILDKANQDFPDMYIKPLKMFP